MSHPTVMYPEKRNGHGLNNKTKSAAALAAANILKTNLPFKLAKTPEAVSTRPASYIHIKPDASLARSPAAEKAQRSNDQAKSTEHSEQEDDDSEESDNESPAFGTEPEDEEVSSSDSDDDGELETIQFGNEDSDKSEEEESEEEEEEEEEEKVETEQVHYKLLDINEDANDKGSRPDSTICKSWGPGARAPRGLLNTGVTCYMNTAIQAMLHVPPFSNFLINVQKKKIPEISNKSVTKELAQLQHKLLDASITRNIYPAAIIRRLDDINPMMSMWQQEDSHEYFMSLLSRVQEDTVPPGKKLRTSILHEIFGGTYEQKVTCQSCKTVSTTHQDFYDLPVSFSNKERKAHGKYTLGGSVNEFFSPAYIKPDKSKKGGYDCEVCKKLTTAVAVSKIEEPSEYLPVNIKRFNFKEKSSRKIKDPIDYPLELDLTEHSTTPNIPLKYKLISVTLHEGRTTSSGHYVAFCHQPNNSWALYDDESVRRVTENVVLRHKEDAYFLIYARLTPVQVASPTKAPAPKPAKKPSVKSLPSSLNSTPVKAAPAPAAATPSPFKSKKKADKKLRRSKSLPDLSASTPSPLLTHSPSSSSKKSSSSSSLLSKKLKHGHGHGHHLKHSKSSSHLGGGVKSPHSALARMSDKINRKRQEKKRALEQHGGHGHSGGLTAHVDRGAKKQKLDSEIDKIFGGK